MLVSVQHVQKGHVKLSQHAHGDQSVQMHRQLELCMVHAFWLSSGWELRAAKPIVVPCECPT